MYYFIYKSHIRRDEQCEYYLKALAVVKHVRGESQPGALTLEIVCRNKIVEIGRTEEEISEMANAILTITKMGSDEIHPDDQTGFMGSKFFVGGLLLGVFKSSYSLSLSLSQVKEGALMVLDACSHKYGKAAISSSATGTFEKYWKLMLSLDPVASQTMCLEQLAALQAYIANIGDLGTRAREIFEAYLPFIFILRVANADFLFVCVAGTIASVVICGAWRAWVWTRS